MPKTPLSASQISPSVTCTRTAARMWGIRLSRPRAARSTSSRARGAAPASRARRSAGGVRAQLVAPAGGAVYLLEGARRRASVTGAAQRAQTLDDGLADRRIALDGGRGRRRVAD